MAKTLLSNDLLRLMKAIEFAAEKHKYQRRRGYDRLPYINHPLKVANLLLENGCGEFDLIVSALLHDALEDTETTAVEIKELFGTGVLNTVLELTDDMELPYAERKRLQIEKAPTLSSAAKKIKIADKICNIRDIIQYPLDWDDREKMEYVLWSEKVISAMGSIDRSLDELFAEEVKRGKELLKKSSEP
jgi:guanosine-3',5'-bis(diphosphate) 3'-pyrophosphohydrolase